MHVEPTREQGETFAAAATDPEWHAVAVVRYPSRSAFLEMVSDAEYLKIAQDRSAGLADSRLIPCDAR